MSIDIKEIREQDRHGVVPPFTHLKDFDRC